LYKDKYIVYEFRPLENVYALLKRYLFLSGKSEIEVYGEGERCSRITAYYGKGNLVQFVQHDNYMDLEASYQQERVESAATTVRSKLVEGFPSHEFGVVNRALVDNFFIQQFRFPIFAADRKRYVCELTPQNRALFKKSFSPVLSSTDITEITGFLQENYDDYFVALRFEIPADDYWKFVNDNRLITDKESKNRFSLFKHKNVFHLAEEK
jgi:hypothetical protein